MKPQGGTIKIRGDGNGTKIFVVVDEKHTFLHDNSISKRNLSSTGYVRDVLELL